MSFLASRKVLALIATGALSFSLCVGTDANATGDSDTFTCGAGGKAFTSDDGIRGCRYESGGIAKKHCGGGIYTAYANGDSNCLFIDYIAVKSKIAATQKGRTLTITVKGVPKVPAFSGKKLITVKVGKKTLKANVYSNKAVVTLPKVKKGTKVKIDFAGQGRLKAAAITVKTK